MTTRTEPHGGDIYLIEVGPGLHGACWVLRTILARRASVVAVTEWLGPRASFDPADARLRKVLAAPALEPHGGRAGPCVSIVCGYPPDTFERVARIEAPGSDPMDDRRMVTRWHEGTYSMRARARLGLDPFFGIPAPTYADGRRVLRGDRVDHKGTLVTVEDVVENEQQSRQRNVPQLGVYLRAGPEGVLFSPVDFLDDTVVLLHRAGEGEDSA